MPSRPRSPGLLLIESNPHRRIALAAALRNSFAVTAVGRIAEIERWPTGDIVVTESRRFTPWWKSIGALHVIVLADTAGEGLTAEEQGATTWISRTCSPDELLETIRRCCAPEPSEEM